jgi:2-polyprenyl-3-methyl-5-hydroxy-6-metoxy-1,4-benzoquinol methylase
MKMCDCCQDLCTDYFDAIAPKWDSWHDLESLNARLDSGLNKFGLQPDEHVLDVGCGTGNLTSAITRRLSESGSVTAIDLSRTMIAIARAKIQDPRITWICDTVEHLENSGTLFDRIICYSVWPHLTDNHRAARLFWQMLAAGGKLHIWHLISREAVNKIHSEASDAVKDHLLAPAHLTASLLQQSGFIIEETQDDDTGYLVTCRKV